MSALTKFNTFLEEAGVGEPIETTRATFEALSRNLAKLPRITREFLAIMIERRETETRGGIGASYYVEINADKLARISRYSDLDGELRVLSSYNFIYIDEPNEPGESAYWRITFPGTPSEFEPLFVEYVQTNGIVLGRPLVTLDFSAF
jgi:hypothetical protein